MKSIDKGHMYKLKCNGRKKYKKLTFYKDKKLNGKGYDGVTNQEVIRALIDRVKFLHKQKPHWVNEKITKHLRYALALHEIRHIERVVKENFPLEKIKLKGKNDHFIPNKHLWKRNKK